jgi:hypothetical protein
MSEEITAPRRPPTSFKDVLSGKKLLEVTPRKLVRVARPTQGWMMTRQTVLENIKEAKVSVPTDT